MFEPIWTEYSRNDYKELDGSQKVFVDKAIDRIRERGMEAGKPLYGLLSSCRKLKHRKMGLRVVFREVADGIEIVAIGKREGKAVYQDAEARLPRSST
jgi:mRNA interferase RelE/StbE